MKIAFGFDIFYPENNGVITSSINLARNLIDMGNEVVFFIPNEKEYKEEVIENGIKLIRVKAIDSYIYKGLKILPYFSWYLNKAFVEQNIDIVHVTSPWLVCVALGRSARKNKTPFLYTHHTLINNPDYINYALKSKKLSQSATSAIWKVIFNPLFKLCWAVTAPSKDTCNELKLHCPSTLPINYISNGIDVSAFSKPKTRDIPKRIVDFGLGDKTFLYIGRLGYEKSIDVLLDGFMLFQKKYKDAKLIIIGKGPAQKDLEQQIQSNNLEKNVLLAGYVLNEDILYSNLLNEINSFVTASLSENQSMTIIESICSGVSIICPNVPNMTDLADEKCAFHFKGGDIEDLANKFTLAYENIDLVKQKRIEAKKNIDRFDGKNVAKQFLAEYQKLLDRKANGFYIPRKTLR
ncbi:MAG: glycosyltransferase [Spirochaetia bacterium]|nr:glycosyltransferase [Spirochaetia bacterium]